MIRCRSSLPVVRIGMLPGVRDASADGAELRIVTTNAVATLRGLCDADADLADLRVADASLEDAIVSLLPVDQSPTEEGPFVQRIAA